MDESVIKRVRNRRDLLAWIGAVTAVITGARYFWALCIWLYSTALTVQGQAALLVSAVVMSAIMLVVTMMRR